MKGGRMRTTGQPINGDKLKALIYKKYSNFVIAGSSLGISPQSLSRVCNQTTISNQMAALLDKVGKIPYEKYKGNATADVNKKSQNDELYKIVYTACYDAVVKAFNEL